SAGRAGGSICCAPAAGPPGAGSWTGTMRRILSIWLPRWPTDRLRLAGPPSPDRSASGGEPPLALVVEERGTARVHAAHAAPAAGGVAVGQKLADARGVLPALAVRPADPAADAAALARLADWCARWTPWAA